MATIDLETLPDWELSVRLTSGSVAWPVRRPGWEDLLALVACEQALSAKEGRPDAEVVITRAIGRLLPADAKPELLVLGYEALMPLYAAIDAYWSDWMGRRGRAAIGAAGLAGPGATGAPAERSESTGRRTGGLELLRPFLRTNDK